MPASPHQGSLRARLLALASQLVEQAGADLARHPLSVVIQAGQGVEITYRALPGELADNGLAVPEGLSPLERSILKVATREPQTAKRFAGKLKRKCNGYFRGTLAGLVRKGLLVHSGQTYHWTDTCPAPAG